MAGDVKAPLRTKDVDPCLPKWGSQESGHYHTLPTHTDASNLFSSATNPPPLPSSLLELSIRLNLLKNDQANVHQGV